MSTQLIESAHIASEQWQWMGEQQDVIKSILETPLFKGEWYWIMPDEALLDYETDGKSYQVNSVQFETLKVVMWGEHPSEFLAEDAVDDGALTDDDLIEDGIPEEIWNSGNEMAKEVLLDLMGDVTWDDVTTFTFKARPQITKPLMA